MPPHHVAGLSSQAVYSSGGYIHTVDAPGHRSLIICIRPEYNPFSDTGSLAPHVDAFKGVACKQEMVKDNKHLVLC